MLKGIPASPGIVIAKAYVVQAKTASVTKKSIKPDEVGAEIKRFRQAVEKTKAEVRAIKEKVIFDIGNSEADIFNAYILLLEDSSVIGKSEKIISEDCVNAEYALKKVHEEYMQFFDRIADSYLKEKSRDVNGLIEKVMRNLAESGSGNGDRPEDSHIVIAQDLSPADTAEMDKKEVLGFVTEVGGANSHTAIVARSLEIPAVVGVRGIINSVKTGDMVIIDGEKGIVIVNPGQKALTVYKAERQAYISRLRVLKRLIKLDAKTADGYKVGLMANIEFPEEASTASANNADGIGLFRTEFVYINKTSLPSEEDQLNAYKTVIESMRGKPVIIRTLDIGGDKFLPYFKMQPEQNPFLGLRAIRLSLSNTNIFKLQLRAILRASAFGPVSIMFPMVTVIDEIDEAKKLLEEVKEELSAKKVPFDRGIKVGTMIEVPSAALLADDFAKKVDFFSIGTNDLIQYTLAVDRGNESVAKYYSAFDPAVLRLIKMVVDSAHRNNLKVSVCGEMAGAPELAVLLIGMGVDELSVSSSSLLTVKKIIRAITFAEVREAGEAALKMKSGSEIRDYMAAKTAEIVKKGQG